MSTKTDTTPASPEPDYRVLLTKFMGFVWDDDCVVCERCADGTWGKFGPNLPLLRTQT